MQHQVLPDQLGAACLQWLENPNQVENLTNRFSELHQNLRLNASRQAAQVVLSVMK